MRKKILFTIAPIFLIFTIFVSYLSIYGIKTDSFNYFINKKIKEYNSKLILKIDKVYIKLNLSKKALNINTKNATLIAESEPIKISNIDINLNLLKFIKKENLIQNIKINSSNNQIKNITSFLNSIDYDLSSYIFGSQVKKGLLNFELDAKFDNLNQDVFSYTILGSVNDAEFNLLENENLKFINFNFQIKNKTSKISNLKFTFQGIDFLSKSLVRSDKLFLLAIERIIP